MGVDNQAVRFDVMPGDMQVADAVCGHGADEFHRLIAMIDTVDVDVVHVKQQVAIRFLNDGTNKLRFVKFTFGRQIVGHILQRHPFADNILNLLHTPGGMGDGFFSEWHGQQVVELAAVIRVGQMFAVNRNPVFTNEISGTRNQRFVQRCGAADGK